MILAILFPRDRNDGKGEAEVRNDKTKRTCAHNNELYEPYCFMLYSQDIELYVFSNTF